MDQTRDDSHPAFPPPGAAPPGATWAAHVALLADVVRDCRDHAHADGLIDPTAAEWAFLLVAERMVRDVAATFDDVLRADAAADLPPPRVAWIDLEQVDPDDLAAQLAAVRALAERCADAAADRVARDAWLRVVNAAIPRVGDILGWDLEAHRSEWARVGARVRAWRARNPDLAALDDASLPGLFAVLSGIPGQDALEVRGVYASAEDAGAEADRLNASSGGQAGGGRWYTTLVPLSIPDRIVPPEQWPPLSLWTPEGRAVHLLENATDASDYAEVRRMVRDELGLDPDAVPHDPPSDAVADASVAGLREQVRVRAHETVEEALADLSTLEIDALGSHPSTAAALVLLAGLHRRALATRGAPQSNDADEGHDAEANAPG